MRSEVAVFSLETFFEGFASSVAGLGICDRSISGCLGVAMVTVGCSGVDGNILTFKTV